MATTDDTYLHNIKLSKLNKIDLNNFTTFPCQGTKQFRPQYSWIHTQEIATLSLAMTVAVETFKSIGAFYTLQQQTLTQLIRVLAYAIIALLIPEHAVPNIGRY